MYALSITVVLALVSFSYAGQDLDVALEIFKCAKVAIYDGVESLGIPPHYPYVAFKENFTWSGDIEIASIAANLTNLTWAGIAAFELSANQTSNDADPVAAFNFTMYWPWFQINGSYSIDSEELFIEQQFEGHFSFDIQETQLAGNIRVNKTGEVLETNIEWDATDINVEITGLGILDGVTEEALKAALTAVFRQHLMGNSIGEIVQYALNARWWPTGKVWQLTDWCQNNNVTLAL